VNGFPPVSWVAVAAQALLVHSFHTATFDGVNPPAWTLAVEAQLYFAYPIVFGLIARRGAIGGLTIVLWASRLFYRYCEAPSIRRAGRAKRGELEMDRANA
jgi:peptidoglycan/LPS O-acetylase OafA/YrhL